MSEIRDSLDRLAESRKLNPDVPPGQGGVEMRRAGLAIVTYGKLAADHLLSLVVALEGSDCWRSLADVGDSERICNPAVPNRPICGRCAELIAVKRDIAKVEEMLA
jgi:hypothetical protein